MREGIAAVDAGRLVRLALNDARLPPGDISVLAVGKAAPGMAVAAVQQLGARVRDGIVVSPSGGPAPGGLEAYRGGHPLPDAASERAGRRALDIAARCQRGSILVLLSGGASALMAVPVHGITLDQKRQTTDALLRAGVDIHALNTVRKHLSEVKGGRLAARAEPPCLTLAISDVVGDDLSVIGSGPTVGDSSTFAGALAVLEAAGGFEVFPQPVVTHLRRGAKGEVAETPRPDDPRLARAEARVIGGRGDAMRGAEKAAVSRGFEVVRLDDPNLGEARAAARAFVARAVERAAARPRPLAVIASGETTVRVTGSGRGGRNQEFALAAAELLPPLGGQVVLASIGTDGIDGPTDAAGAIVDSTTTARAAGAGLVPSRYLEDNDAYALLATLGELINTGPTGTNVGDLQVMLLG